MQLAFVPRRRILLKSSVALSAYQTWARMSPEPVSALPPERFHFEVVRMA